MIDKNQISRKRRRKQDRQYFRRVHKEWEEYRKVHPEILKPMSEEELDKWLAGMQAEMEVINLAENNE